MGRSSSTDRRSTRRRAAVWARRTAPWERWTSAPDRRSRQEQRSGDREGSAGDDRARAADQGSDHLVESGADVAARVCEQEEHAERHRGEAPAERVNLNQVAAAEHQRADDDERRPVAGVAHERPQAVDDCLSAGAALPPR